MGIIWALVSSNWNLVMGRAGIYSFCQLSFFAIGGYTSGILAKFFGISPFIGLLAGGLLAATIGILIGLLTFRLRSVYVALFTISFQEVLRIFIHSTGTGSVTGGSKGLMWIPGFQIGTLTFSRIHYYYLGLALFSLSILLIHKVLNSPAGLTLVAYRDSEEYALSRGVNPIFCKILVFTVSSFLTGTIGAFYAHYLGMIDPVTLSFNFEIPILTMMVIGGWGSVFGPVIGAFILVTLTEYLRAVEAYRLLILSGITIIIVILAPSGVVGVISSMKSKFSRAGYSTSLDTARRNKA
jgi:branched-chain amino acid transport system permease protein